MAKSEKRQRFEKVAGSRVQKVLDTLHQMFSEITKAIKDSRAAYVNELHKANKQGFTFK